MSAEVLVLLRKPAVLARAGFGTTTLYRRIEQGLFTKPVRIGTRLSAWPESEVEALNLAIVAGKSEDEIRALVQQLEDARSQASRVSG